ncbi:hypothetical protein [Paracoccus mutanolyticus]|uniref:hypothetical protein n=1 Tax=Paracoccus mutanolyticus TaxID=1499308 RepID=UPI00167740A4|nr:hypothetical protein [Paracoccus mutanolyticus]
MLLAQELRARTLSVFGIQHLSRSLSISPDGSSGSKARGRDIGLQRPAEARKLAWRPHQKIQVSGLARPYGDELDTFLAV